MFKRTVFTGLVLAAAMAAVSPALARPPWDRGYDRGRDHWERERWRERHGYGFYGGGYRRPPPVVYYAPRPRPYYPPPGIFIPFR